MKHPDEAADRALFNSMMQRDKTGAVCVNPAGTNQVYTTYDQVGIVPLEKTMQKPQAYKQTKGAP